MKVDAGTITRTIVLIIALINNLLVMTGHEIINISDETVSQLVSALFTIGAALWAWWYDNDWTKIARQKREYKKELLVDEKRMKAERDVYK